MDFKELPVIIRNSNVSLIEGRGRERIYRVLGYNDSYVYAVELGTAKTRKDGERQQRLYIPNPPSTLVRNRLAWPRSDVDAWLREGTLVHVAEHGIPAQMNDYRLPPEGNPMLEVRRNVVEHIEQHWGDRVLEDTTAYAKAIRTAAARSNVSESSARKWFEMHLFYGGHKNALIDHDWLKGAPGVSRRDLRDARGRPAQLGRRTTIEKTFKNKGHKRRRLTSQQCVKYDNFLKAQAYDNNDPFYVVYDRWIISQVAYNRDSDGNLVTYQVDPKNFPGDENMRRVGRKLLKKHRAERDEQKRRKPGNNGGSAQDIVHDQLPVLDIDGTVASNFILYGDEEIHIEGEGKPTVLLAVDRGSLAIVGWKVSYRAENGDAYLNCVYSACTPKDRELLRWDVPYLQGMVYGCTSEVFIDRGSGISMKTQTSLVDQFRTASKMAEPGSPESKGHVEQVMKYFQEELAFISGSTFKTGDKDEDRKRQKHARKGAIPLKQFMQALLRAISRRNLEAIAGHLQTPDMSMRNVGTSPAEIYRYNKSRRRGDAAWDWAPEDVFRRLCVSKVKKAPRGIVTHGKREFTSPELLLFANNHAKLHGGDSVKIKIYVMPDAPSFLLWELEGQGLGLLEWTMETKKRYEDGLDFSIEFLNIYRALLDAETKLISRKHVISAIKQEKALVSTAVSTAKQARIRSVERNAADEMARDSTDGPPRTQAQRNLERANVESILSEFNLIPPAENECAIPDVRRDRGRSSIDDEQDLFIDF